MYKNVIDPGKSVSFVLKDIDICGQIQYLMCTGPLSRTMTGINDLPRALCPNRPVNLALIGRRLQAISKFQIICGNAAAAAPCRIPSSLSLISLTSEESWLE